MLPQFRIIAACVSVLATPLMWAHAAHAQAIGTYDNFDAFNDTGTEAEGFEIDIEDVKPADVLRIFPDNFPAGSPYIRYATPYRGSLTLVKFADGHRGVSIVYAAKYVSGQWRTIWGNTIVPGSTAKLGNGTPFVASPSYTTGESCWSLGLGASYPASGCDHFGYTLSRSSGAVSLHWLVPDPAHPGKLIKAPALASLPPGPVMSPVVVAPGQPLVAHVVDQPPENPEFELQQLCSNAYWLKTYTSYNVNPVDLNKLQQNIVPLAGSGVTVAWKLLQHCPASVDVDKAENERDTLPKGAVGITKRHEYYAYAGAYDSNHEVACGGDQSCDVPAKGQNGVSELGPYEGAHNAALDIK